MRIFYSIMSSPALLLAIVAVASVAIGSTRHWLRGVRLRDRQQFVDEEFGKSFFAGGGRESTAVRIRRVLAKNLELDLDGVRPHDRLDDDLNAQISTNVSLFWQLEKEFQIDSQVEDPEIFEKITSQLVTFSDLVGYIQKKIDEQLDVGEKDKAADSDEPAVDWEDVIGYSWFAGLAMFVASSMFDVDWLMRVGLTVAFLPITVGIAYDMYQGFSEIASVIRANGLGVLLNEPLSLIIWLAVLIPFLLIGSGLSWVLFNLYFGSE